MKSTISRWNAGNAELTNIHTDQLVTADGQNRIRAIRSRYTAAAGIMFTLQCESVHII